MAICIYMIVVNSMYVVKYASSYGMTLSDMKLDAIQYIVTGSISYFVYGALLFAAGRIISMLQKSQSFRDLQSIRRRKSVRINGHAGHDRRA
ncbi:MAG: hypothetical protein V8R14_03900 [Clostridia bacterium]